MKTSTDPDKRITADVMISHPLVVPPSASAYQFYAFPLAIIETRPESQDWVLSNFIQTCFNPDHMAPVPFCHFLYDYRDNPFLTSHSMTWDWVRELVTSPTGFIAEQVQSGYYVYLSADEFYVPRRPNYQRMHFVHDMLVVGSTPDGSQFEVAGFDERGVFGRTLIDGPALKAAITHGWELDGGSRDLVLYHLKGNATYDLDLELIRQTLTEFAQGLNTSEHYRMTMEPWIRVYGIGGYDEIAGYFRAYADGRAPQDPRHLQVLREHVELMHQRGIRLARLAPELAWDGILNDLTALESGVNATRSRSLLAFARSPKWGHRIADELTTLRSRELDVVVRMIEHLDVMCADLQPRVVRMPEHDPRTLVLPPSPWSTTPAGTPVLNPAAAAEQH